MLRPLCAALLALAFAVATLMAAPPCVHADPSPLAQPGPPVAPAPTLAQGELTPGARALLAGEDPALGTTVPDLGQASGRDLVGKPVRRVEVVVVGGRWLSPPAVTAVKPNDPASPEAARRLMREALATGRVARANVEAFAADGGVVLRLNVLPSRLIASVQVNGGVLDSGETLDAAGVAVGGELTSPRLAEIEARIARFYHQHGFLSASAHARTADTDQHDRVILSLDITPGKPRTVARRIFVVDPVFDREVGDLRSSYKLDAGDRVDEPSLVDADKELGETLRQHGFFRAEVRHRLLGSGGFTYLYVYLAAGPRFVPSFEGNRSFDAADLEQALNLEKAPDARTGELVERLRAFYLARGFLDVEVSAVEQGGASSPVHYLVFTVREHRQVRVTKRVFPCLTGDMSPDDIGAEIDSFLDEDLPGAEPFGFVNPRTVAKLFGPTSPIGGRGGIADLNPRVTYAAETYDRAVKHVRDLLHAKGYLNAVVGPIAVIRATCSKRSRDGQCLPEPLPARLAARCVEDALGMPVPEPPVPESFTCHPDPARDVECSPEMTVRIPIALGPQTTLYDIAFEGNHAFNSKELGRIADLSLGERLSSVELDEASLRVLDAYRKEGYAYAEVHAEQEDSPDRTRSRVHFYVTEREKVIVTDVVVTGATRTSEALVLGRVALRKGFPYRQDWVRQTEERIASLGTFQGISVALEDADVPERQKRVMITVAEQRPQYVDPRVGFSTGDGLRFTFEYGHRNLGGAAIALTMRVQLSYLPDFFILDPTVLANYRRLTLVQRLERRDTIALTFHDIGLGPLYSLTLEAIDLNDNERDFGIDKEALVPTITYRPIRPLSVQLGVSTELNDVTVFNDTAAASTYGLIRAPQGRTLAFAQRLGFTADYRDNPFNPTKGVLFAASVEHVDALPVDAAALFTSHFFRLTGKVSGYFTRGGITLAASLAAGGNVQLDSASATYPDRLFFLGGGDTVRSYLDNSMVPQDLADQVKAVKLPGLVKDPASGLPLGQRSPQSGLPTGQGSLTIEDLTIRGGDLSINPRLEARFPLLSWLQAAVFLDAGNLWIDPGLIRLDSDFMRFGLGPGLRIPTPVGPLALDYGFNLNRRQWEDVGAFHFSIGLF